MKRSSTRARRIAIELAVLAVGTIFLSMLAIFHLESRDNSTVFSPVSRSLIEFHPYPRMSVSDTRESRLGSKLKTSDLVRFHRNSAASTRRQVETATFKEKSSGRNKTDMREPLTRIGDKPPSQTTTLDNLNIQENDMSKGDRPDSGSVVDITRQIIPLAKVDASKKQTGQNPVLSLSQLNESDGLLELRRDVTGAVEQQISTPATSKLTQISPKSFTKENPSSHVPWDTLDPLNINKLTSQDAQIDYVPQVEYLGVLVDAGRHYFSVAWMKRLVKFLYRLRFNMIHLRLTDDQNFNIRLDSYPQLAFSTGGNVDQVYSAVELRELVAFAKQYNISIVPEINVPGHAGAWAGIPDLVLNCPNFICDKGYGIPMNLDHPDLQSILRGVLKEVIDIFDNPPFLHLGGDEVHLSKDCYRELNISMGFVDFPKFERTLIDILKDINYPETQVIRWETTGHTLRTRAGKIQHYWQEYPKGSGATATKNSLLASVEPETTKSKKPGTFFVSTGLYFDTSNPSDAVSIVQNVLVSLNLQRGFYPKGIVVGTFELGENFWVQRNVAARLIAVALAASKVKGLDKELKILYNSTCRALDIDQRICDLQGGTTSSELDFKTEWRNTWSEWKGKICDRYTLPRTTKLMKQFFTSQRDMVTLGANAFWQNFGETTPRPVLAATGEHHPMVLGDLISSQLWTRGNHSKLIRGASKIRSLQDHSTRMSGVILDVISSLPAATPEWMNELLKTYLSPFGINVVQLRLVDDHGFAIHLMNQSDELPYANYPHGERMDIPSSGNFSVVVDLANKLGIEIMPEISISTNAGGWVHAGFLAECPNVICDVGKGVANKIDESTFVPVVYSVIRELLTTFSSKYIHLGADERQGSLACFHESGIENPSFGEFETKLANILQLLGVNDKRVIRWENEEHVRYPDRTGSVTHYRSITPFTRPLTVRDDEEYLLTINLLDGSTYDVYKHTLELLELKPRGIFAEIRIFDEYHWRTKSIGLRLLAYVLALQKNEKEIPESEFPNKLVEACMALHLPNCKGQQEAVPFTIIVDSAKSRNDACGVFTVSKADRVAREHIERYKSNGKKEGPSFQLNDDITRHLEEAPLQ